LATTKDGGSFIADLSMAEIDKRRAMSRASRDDAPWKQWFEEMCRKTALRVLSKLLPKSSDIDIFLQRDEAESLGVDTVQAIDDQRGAAFGNVLDHFAGSTADEPKTVSAPSAQEIGTGQGAVEETQRAAGEGDTK
jgi:recombination protein RecT